MRAVGALPSLMDQQTSYRLYIYGAFRFMTPGTGTVKPNAVAFRADQYDLASPHEVTQQAKCSNVIGDSHVDGKYNT